MYRKLVQSRTLVFLFFILIFLYPSVALAQSFSLDLGDGPSSTGRIIQLFLLITVLSLAPSILVMMTSFTRIVVVLSFLRTAMGTQTTPPNQVIMSLALFLTIFIMMPTLEKSWDQGIRPFIDGEIEEKEAFSKSTAPVREFMLKHVREKDLKIFLDASGEGLLEKPSDIPLKTLIPAFMISELRRAFEIGFLVFSTVYNEALFGISFALCAGIMIYVALNELLPVSKEYGEPTDPIIGVTAGMIVMAISLIMLYA